MKYIIALFTLSCVGCEIDLFPYATKISKNISRSIIKNADCSEEKITLLLEVLNERTGRIKTGHLSRSLFDQQVKITPEIIQVILLLITSSAFAQHALINGTPDLKSVSRDYSKLLDAKQKAELLKDFSAGIDDEVETAARMLALDFAPYVKTLNRDIVTYN